jgi:hypothetical protein
LKDVFELFSINLNPLDSANAKAVSGATYLSSSKSLLSPHISIGGIGFPVFAKTYLISS